MRELLVVVLGGVLIAGFVAGVEDLTGTGPAARVTAAPAPSPTAASSPAPYAGRDVIPRPVPSRPAPAPSRAVRVRATQVASAPASRSEDRGLVDVGGGPTALQWWHLRDCEASGDYGLIDPPYYGAYQFDRPTWASTLEDLLGVRVTGLPSDASPALQDRAARALYEERGRAPWPHCGALWL